MYQNNGNKQGELFPNYELFSEFNIDFHSKLNEEQQLAEITNFIEENVNDN